jgi:hypothetical protein
VILLVYMAAGEIDIDPGTGTCRGCPTELIEASHCTSHAKSWFSYHIAEHTTFAMLGTSCHFSGDGMKLPGIEQRPVSSAVFLACPCCEENSARLSRRSILKLGLTWRTEEAECIPGA